MKLQFKRENGFPFQKQDVKSLQECHCRIIFKSKVLLLTIFYPNNAFTLINYKFQLIILSVYWLKSMESFKKGKRELGGKRGEEMKV